MYYITANQNGLDGIVREITTTYTTLEKVFDFLRTKTNYQRSRYFVRSIGSDGKDSGLVYEPKDIELRISGAQIA